MLNSLGQVFTFGEGLRGQLGDGQRKLAQNRVLEIEMPDIQRRNKNTRKPTITRIKANAYDTAAFDDVNNRVFTWGSFGNLRLSSEKLGHRWPQFAPKMVDLKLVVDKSNNYYCLAPNEYGVMKIPGVSSKLEEIENIYML